MAIVYDWVAGKVFGSLTLTGKSYFDDRCRYVEFICKCGVVKWVRFDSIKIGKTKSCGCYRKEKLSNGVLKHGLSGHTLNKKYNDMIDRCYKVKRKDYKNYGGRGINVCDEWLNDFMSFYNWCIENGWKDGLSIDRKDNDGHYTPNNCRCTTDYIQRRNKRTNKNIEIFGEIKCVTDWSIDLRCAVQPKTFMQRIRNGWGNEKALLTPVLINRRLLS